MSHVLLDRRVQRVQVVYGRPFASVGYGIEEQGRAATGEALVDVGELAGAVLSRAQKILDRETAQARAAEKADEERERRLAEAETELEAREKTMAENEAKLAAQLETNETWGRNHAALSLDHEAHVREVEAQRARVADLGERLTRLEASLVDREARLDRSERQTAQLARELDARARDLEQREQTVTALRRGLAHLSTKPNSVEDPLPPRASE